jgi:hypothetical protein
MIADIPVHRQINFLRTSTNLASYFDYGSIILYIMRNDKNRMFDTVGASGILLLLIVILLLLGVFVASDFGYIAYTKQQYLFPTATPVPGVAHTPIVAHGSFTKDKYSVGITLYFTREGGAVSGEFSGACTGAITGSYDGTDGGTISGTAVGSCDPFLIPIPAKAQFSGIVNQQQKTVSLDGTGSAAGISGSGSLVLTY